MKFKKLSLDESLFDTELDWLCAADQSNDTVLQDYDDDFIDGDYSDEHIPQEAMRGPDSGSDAGVTDILITAINDEWETIRSYNSLIETLKYESTNNPEYKAFIEILNEINSEENKHIGQLQEMLEKLSPNAQFIDKGREEGRSQFNFANGQLQVECWGPKTSVVDQKNSTPNAVEDVCTLSDVDDDM